MVDPIKPCVSVVIAVYNAEEYIAQCCHSLFAQTLENLEYIFIDDCSPDHSMEIVHSVLKEYPHRDKQVKIIQHSSNQGVSKTREEGVKAASGEYLIHCDPDDWTELNMYERLYNKAVSEDADIVLCDYWNHYYNDPGQYYIAETPKELTCRSLLASCLHAQHPLMSCSLCNKMIRTSYYNNVEWPNQISYSEDVIVCVQILNAPSLKISYDGQAYYHYRLKKNSLSHRSLTKQDVENDYAVIQILHSHLCKMEDLELYHIWQASVSDFMLSTLEAPKRYFSNKKFINDYGRYRNHIWKNVSISRMKKILLYCATYNFYLSFAIYKKSKRLKLFFRKIKSN